MTWKWRLVARLIWSYGLKMSLVYLVCALFVLSSSLISLTVANDVYIVDKSRGITLRYDGIGGLSGGGATSKLLVNYPQEQRDQILDYLFKPQYGASLSILKVEIGGDAQSTDGTESSHMHNSWDENYNRGYEWWLMKEAKKRNPDICLYCLPWAFPAWVGDGTRNPYKNPQLTANYVVKYILGAQKYHGLQMDYVGIWNERAYDSTYIKVLRKTLDTNNLTEVQIVAADGFWEPLSLDMLADKDLAAAVDIIGVHYPGTKGSETAVKTGKQLWSSEDYSTFNDNVGAGCWARILNQNFVNGNMTSTISWNLIASYYEALPFKRDGLMTADSPWSGHYRVETPIWMTAHTTWFTSPGWYYFPNGFGSSHLKKGGSMVTIGSFDNIHFTMVIETMSHDHSLCIRPALPAYTVEPQNVTLEIHGGYSWVKEVNVWYSKLMFNGEPSTLLQKKGTIPVVNGTTSLSLGVDEVYTLVTLRNSLDLDQMLSYLASRPVPSWIKISLITFGRIRVVNGTISLSLGVDEVYTLTTLQLSDKPNYPPVPDKKPFPLPYQDDFESYSISEEPYNFAPQVGVFEVTPTRDSFHTQVMTQVVLENPIFWCLFVDLVFPMGVIGNSNWTDIYVEADTHIGPVNGSSGVYVAARVENGGCNSYKAQGFFFFLFPEKGSIEVTGDLARTQKLYEQKVSVNPGDWNTLGLLLHNGYVSGSLNGDVLFNIPTPEKSPTNGFVALGTADYGLAEFDNLKIMEGEDGLQRMVNHDHGPLSDKIAYGPSFNGRRPELMDRKVKTTYSKHNFEGDNTLYYRPLNKIRHEP